MFKPTAEQEAILSAARDTEDNLMVKAYAGCAKTTTLELITKALPDSHGVLLAFNVSIKKELEKRVGSNFAVMTLNGLGHRAWSQVISGRLVLDDSKIASLVTAAMKKHSLLSKEDWLILKNLVSGAMNVGLVPRGIHAKPLVADTDEVWQDFVEDSALDPKFIPIAREILTSSCEQSLSGRICYSDQIYMPVCFGGAFPGFPLVMVDEAQDLSPMNHIMIKRTARKRLIVVGDDKQCHPPGTMISVTGRNPVSIENIRVGQELVSFNSRKTYFPGVNTQGRKVLAKNEFEYTGDIITIYAEKYTHDCTPNHRCLVRMLETNLYAIYLMQRGTNFRIGKAKINYSHGFGPGLRARQEGADAVWILTTVTGEDQALVEEKVLSAEFGIPDLMFRNNGFQATPQHKLDNAWNRIGDNTGRAKTILEAYYRQMEFPLWEKGAEVKLGYYSFITQACNLISGAMEIKIFDGDPRNNKWSPITISHTPYSGKVIGIEVEPTEDGRRLYIANGIVTHNSIYAWRGADSDSMNKLKALRPNWIELPLHTTFRCPQVAVKRASSHAPGFTAAASNKEGTISRLPNKQPKDGLLPSWSWPDVEEIAKEGEIAVICRNNAPLLSLAFKLLRQRIGVKMIGRDIGKGLVTLAKKLLPLPGILPAECQQLISHWMEREISIASANHDEAKVERTMDRGECLLAVLDSGPANSREFIENLDALFAREDGRVILSSGHRAKGLEWDTVLHLDPWRIPSKWAISEEAKKQEANLRYVIETRMKEHLILASINEFQAR